MIILCSLYPPSERNPNDESDNGQLRPLTAQLCATFCQNVWVACHSGEEGASTPAATVIGPMPERRIPKPQTFEEGDEGTNSISSEKDIRKTRGTSSASALKALTKKTRYPSSAPGIGMQDAKGTGRRRNDVNDGGQTKERGQREEEERREEKGTGRLFGQDSGWRFRPNLNAHAVHAGREQSRGAIEGPVDPL